MSNFPRDEQNGCLIGPDGCHYDTDQQVYHFAYLKLCGCGDPEGAYNFCRDALKFFDRRNEPWINAQDALRDLISSKPEMAAHVFAHLLSELDLLEHGGSVGGSWLTEKGQQIVDAPAAEEDSI